MTVALQKNSARIVRQGNQAQVLASIYEDNVNLAVWQRTLSDNLQKDLRTLLDSGFSINVTQEIRANCVMEDLSCISKLDAISTDLLIDIVGVIDMYAYLFDAEQVGLRMRTLTSAMCPKFHEDRVVCRLITTYAGVATQWLPDEAINRHGLGGRSNGKKAADSKLYARENQIQTMNVGDIALLKGAAWPGNENNGVVHRSPQLKHDEKRLILTLDCM